MFFKILILCLCWYDGICLLASPSVSPSSSTDSWVVGVWTGYGQISLRQDSQYASPNLTFWLVVWCHQRLSWPVAKPRQTEKWEGPKCQHLFGLTILPLPFFRLNNCKQKPQEKPGWICKYKPGEKLREPIYRASLGALHGVIWTDSSGIQYTSNVYC